MPPPSHWIDNAFIAVNQAVDQLVDEFMAMPYRYRSEDSLRSRLFALLSATDALVEPVALARQTKTSRRRYVQPLQAEWPVKVPAPREPGKRLTRGRYDVAILNPDFLQMIRPTVFENGRVVTPFIAIEIGLRAADRLGHLGRDHDKMVRNNVPHPYLVDFARVGRYNRDLERRIDAISDPFKVAYAHFADGWGRRIKHIDTRACERA